MRREIQKKNGVVGSCGVGGTREVGGGFLELSFVFFFFLLLLLLLLLFCFRWVWTLQVQREMAISMPIIFNKILELLTKILTFLLYMVKFSVVIFVLVVDRYVRLYIFWNPF